MDRGDPETPYGEKVVLFCLFLAARLAGAEDWGGKWRKMGLLTASVFLSSI